MITQENTLFIAARRNPAPRIHAIPAPKASIVRFVDAIDSPVVLVSRDGRLAAMNGPARDFFIGRPGLQLRESVESFARSVIGDRKRPAESAPNRAHMVEIGSDRFIATIVAAGADLTTQDVGAMVLLKRERLDANAPLDSEHAIAKRFGLTGQEARVAVMLADHRSNRDIAAALGVSVHTARHHTERVLAKLHIHSRYDVKRVVG